MLKYNTLLAMGGAKTSCYLGNAGGNFRPTLICHEQNGLEP
jgi:hypothetical protein